nr:putative reverse transcriptase domain-containing protein [Tanacetum cinerariifolium]
MEQELWTLTLKGDNINDYNNRFDKLALMCPDLVTPENKKIKRHIRGLLEIVKENITYSKHTTLHDAINMARELVEQAVQGRAASIGTSVQREKNQQNEGARARAYVIGTKNPQQNPNVITGSFDVIVGMDWLSYHPTVIVCYEKIVRILLSNGEILEIQGGRPEKDLKLLSCIKVDEKKPKYIHVVCDFPEVFPDNLSGLPPVR